MNPSSSSVTPSLEGELILKRRSLWVRRHGSIENQIFAYRKSKHEAKVNVSIDLRQARVKYTTTGNTSRENLVQEQDPA